MSSPIVELHAADTRHICLDLTIEKAGVRVSAACRLEAFVGPLKITARASKRGTDLVVVPERASDTIQFYSVLIPANLLLPGLRFEARDGAGRTTAVWTAGTTELDLPEGWRFSRYTLVLEYGPPPSKPVDNDCRIFLHDFSLHDTGVRMQLAVFANDVGVLAGTNLKLFRFRNEDEQKEFPLQISEDGEAFGIPAAVHSKFTDRNLFLADAELPLPDAFDRSALHSILIAVGETMRSIYTYDGSQEDKASVFRWHQEGGESLILHYFSDPASKNIRLEAFRFLAADLPRVNEVLTPTVWDGTEPVWLVGEYPNTARDNGWALFEYMRDGRSGIDARYVIADPNMDGVQPDNNAILRYGSLEHLEACKRAQALLFTHHAVYIYPDLLKEINESTGHKPIMHFVQHGVLAIKPMLASYEKGRHSYDLFNVSSKREQRLVVNRCKWNVDDVAICGLPRWDALRRKNIEFLRQGRQPSRVLIFPTWRPSLDKLPEESFRQSTFYENWAAATRKIVEIANARGLEVDFCSHSIFERFGTAFDHLGANSVRIRDAIGRLPDYIALVTDYSSLCFDFLYLNKPSLFFMFDRDVVFARERPYINVETELPGIAALSLSDLDEAVSKTLDGALPKGLVPSNYVKTEAGNCQRVIDETSKKLFALSAKAVRSSFESGDYASVIRGASALGNFTSPFAILDENLLDIRTANTQALLRSGHIGESLEELKKIEHTYGMFPRLAAVKARALWRAGDIDAALAAVDSGYLGLSADTQKDNARELLLLKFQLLLWSDGDIDAALATVQGGYLGLWADTQNGNARELLLLKFQLLLSGGRDVQARQLLAEGLAEISHSDAVGLLARTVSGKKDLPEFEQAVLPNLSNFGSDTHEVLFEYAQLLHSLDVTDRAILVARERFLTAIARHKFGSMPKLGQDWGFQALVSLTDLTHRFHKENIAFFLAGQTLLAFANRETLSGHPQTIELGVPEHIPMAIVRAVLDSSRTWSIRRQHGDSYLEAQHVNGVTAEISSYSAGEGVVHHSNADAVWSNSPFDLDTVEFLGQSCLAPADIDLYLSEMFGDWRNLEPKARTLVESFNRQSRNPQAEIFSHYLALGDSFLIGHLERFRKSWMSLQEIGFADPLITARANDILDNVDRYREPRSASATRPKSKVQLAGLSPLNAAERNKVPSAARRLLRDIVRIPMSGDDLLLEARFFNDLLIADPANAWAQKKLIRAAFLAARAKLAAREYEDACKIWLSIRRLPSGKAIADKNLIMAALRGARQAEASRDRKLAFEFWNYLKLADPDSNVAAQGILRCSS